MRGSSNYVVTQVKSSNLLSPYSFISTVDVKMEKKEKRSYYWNTSLCVSEQQRQIYEKMDGRTWVDSKITLGAGSRIQVKGSFLNLRSEFIKELNHFS